MLSLYFAYTVYGFTFAFLGLSVQYELVNKYEYGPSELAFAWSSVSLPWAFKPLYGYISDRCGRRICVSVGSMASGLCLAYLPHFGKQLVLGLTLSSLFMCFADVASDCIVVIQTKKYGKTVQSTCWTARSFGGMIGTGLSGVAYNLMGFTTAQVASIGLFVLSLIIWNIAEPPNTQSSFKDAFKSVWGMRHLLLIAVFVELMPEIDNSLFPTVKRKLQPVEISITSIIGSLTACFVSFFYQYMTKDRLLMRTAVCLGILSGFLALGTYNMEHIFFIESLRSVIGGISGMFFVLPLVTQAAEMSSDGSEGVSYALFLSIMNLAGVVGETAEAFMLQKLRDVGLFIVVASVISWLPWLVI